MSGGWDTECNDWYTLMPTTLSSTPNRSGPTKPQDMSITAYELYRHR